MIMVCVTYNAASRQKRFSNFDLQDNSNLCKYSADSLLVVKRKVLLDPVGLIKRACLLLCGNKKDICYHESRNGIAENALGLAVQSPQHHASAKSVTIKTKATKRDQRKLLEI